MPVSPRTEAFMQPPPTEEDAAQAFETGFSQLAHRTFSNKHPDLVESVVTFKILQTDLETNAGVGAFILDIDGIEVFVPTVLANSQIKPLDMMYLKHKDIFLPLTPEWIEEISRESLDQLGEGVEPPKSLNPDVDVREVVVPPTAGRYAYAAEQPKGMKLAHFLSEAPNNVKEAFRVILENDHSVLKYAAENLDWDMLIEAMRPTVEKTAAAESTLDILTPDDSSEKFKAVFGNGAPAAWEQAVKVGYVVRDSREYKNRAVVAEGPLHLTNVQENGFYNVYKSDGSSMLALVISDPQSLESNLLDGNRTDATPRPDQYRKRHKKQRPALIEGEREDYSFNGNPIDDHDQEFLLFTEDGKIITTRKPPVGERVHKEFVTGRLAELMNGSQGAMKGTGFFFCPRGGKFRGTKVETIADVTTDSSGVRRARTMGGRVLVTDPNSPIKEIVAPAKSNVAYIPEGYVFVKGDREFSTRLLEGADDTLSHVMRLEKTGALKVKLIDAGQQMFSIGGLEPTTKLGTVVSLVDGLSLSQGEAESLMKTASSVGRASFYVVNPAQMTEFVSLTKEAQGEMPPAQAGPGPQGAMPMGGPPEGMPAEGAMPPEAVMPPPEMMVPPPPPPPNPVELAAAEVEADLSQQSAMVTQQLAEEQRDLANRVSAIAAVKQRAAEIAGEMAGVAPAGEMPPVPQEPPMGGMPPEMGMAPPGGMPPEMGMAPPGGMPPEMGMAPPGGMPPGMPMEGPSAEEMAMGAGPMMGDAAGVAERLNDPEAFEATAIGALAANATLRDTVADYMPTLEKAIDHLGRVLLTMWMEEAELKEEIGEEDFVSLESQLLTVFNNLGSLVLKINQTAMPMAEENAEVA